VFIGLFQVDGPAPASVYELQPGENRQIRDSVNTSKKCKIVVMNYHNMTWSDSMEIYDNMPKGRETRVRQAIGIHFAVVLIIRI